VILKEDGTSPNRRVDAINYQNDNPYLERPLNGLSIYLHITKIPDLSCDSSNYNGLSK
jgi:hypothetical protein